MIEIGPKNSVVGFVLKGTSKNLYILRKLKCFKKANIRTNSGTRVGTRALKLAISFYPA